MILVCAFTYFLGIRLYSRGRNIDWGEISDTLLWQDVVQVWAILDEMDGNYLVGLEALERRRKGNTRTKNAQTFSG